MKESILEFLNGSDENQSSLRYNKKGLNVDWPVVYPEYALGPALYEF